MNGVFLPAAGSSGAKPPIWKRCLFGGALLLLLFGILKVDAGFDVPWISVTLTILCGMVGLLEYQRLLRGRCHPWLCGLFVLGLLVSKTVLLIKGGDAHLAVEVSLVGLATCALLVETLAGEPQAGVPRVAGTLFGLCYFLLFSFLLDVLLRPAAPLGLQLAFLLVLTAKSTDIGGYLVGSLVGGRKLSPRVSPGKTRSGAAGGILLSMAVAAYGGWLVAPSTGTWHWLLFGLVVGVASLFGDLAESVLKRFSGSKDSANLIPTFGGALDILDSLVLAAPVGYWMLVWLVGVSV
ncbi:MAG: phosphatidate cytidylyltransferase [Planctomycetota bacterium]